MKMKNIFTGLAVGIWGLACIYLHPQINHGVLGITRTQKTFLFAVAFVFGSAVVVAAAWLIGRMASRGKIPAPENSPASASPSVPRRRKSTPVIIAAVCFVLALLAGYAAMWPRSSLGRLFRKRVTRVEAGGVRFLAGDSSIDLVFFTFEPVSCYREPYSQNRVSPAPGARMFRIEWETLKGRLRLEPAAAAEHVATSIPGGKDVAGGNSVVLLAPNASEMSVFLDDWLFVR
ncbi:MAG: hypothetical protein JW909_13575 [Planctomycetes bacterium]|nr:hypothetical protein [Planctomycetota bacterium]